MVYLSFFAEEQVAAATLRVNQNRKYVAFEKKKQKKETMS